MNSMQAVACATLLNIDKNDIERSFKSFLGVKGRLEKSELFKGRGFAVFIDYAHTPDALLKVLTTINSFKKTEQRIVVLFGCGGDREKQKRPIMGKIASENADFVIITNDNPRSENPNSIINDILFGISDKDNFAVIPNRKKAIEYAIATARQGDIILLAGKGHENYEINSLGKIHFDEREILQEMYHKYYEKEK
jgi:UDP-N-acetylmuramoyl-L-alanyl-D-glutamate--2,6-diaminopimelate ligase